MKIKIKYESIWNNSFLDGDNNSKLPKGGRKYIASSNALKDENNFKKAEISHNTVMGILNLLIGGRDKLYRLRERDDYYFKNKEHLIRFENNVENINKEISYLRNFNNYYDKNSFCGYLNDNHPLISSHFSLDLWSVLFADINDICDYIQNNKPIPPISTVSANLIINEVKKIEEKQKSFYKKGYQTNPIFSKVISTDKFITSCGQKWVNDYSGLKDGIVKFSSLYFTALYKKLDEINASGINVSKALTPTGKIPGFSRNGFTGKEFKGPLSSGGKKKGYGNPYIIKTRKKGEGEVMDCLKKTSGTLIINVDLSEQDSFDLRDKIESAGVLTFPLGKKGLAYVERIEI